jgi:hypothetical protein
MLSSNATVSRLSVFPPLPVACLIAAVSAEEPVPANINVAATTMAPATISRRAVFAMEFADEFCRIMILLTRRLPPNFGLRMTVSQESVNIMLSAERLTSASASPKACRLFTKSDTFARPRANAGRRGFVRRRFLLDRAWIGDVHV